MIEQPLHFAKNITESKQYLGYAIEHVENRIDAEIFFHIVVLFEQIIGKDDASSRKKEVDKIISLMWRFKCQSLGFETPQFLIQMSYSVFDLNKTVNHLNESKSWYDFKKELLNLFEFCHKLKIYSGFNNLQSNYEKNINDVLEVYFTTNLFAERTRIENLYLEVIEGTEYNDEAKKFLFDLKALLNTDSNEESKKKSYEATRMKLARHFPNIPDEEISDIEPYTENGFNHIIKIISLHQNIDAPSPLITGYTNGDVIYNELMKEINGYLPKYPSEHLNSFCVPLREIIQFQIMSSKGSRKTYSVLYQKESKENDFQEMIENHFLRSRFAELFKTEVKETADGGRIDIEFKNGGMIFPIEIKKVEEKPDWKSISENFLSQAQTYTYPNYQLGFLVVFDKSDKSIEKTSPINNIQSLFKIQQLQAYYDIPDKNPCFIISVIIPANRIVPSARTKYS